MNEDLNVSAFTKYILLLQWTPLVRGKTNTIQTGFMVTDVTFKLKKTIKEKYE